MTTTAPDTVAISVHGPRGVLDLVVPTGAVVTDVAREYAAQSGLRSIPLLGDSIGRPLPADARLDDAGVLAGDVLVATTGVHRSRRGAGAPEPSTLARPGPLATLWCAAAAASALIAGVLAAGAGEDQRRWTVVVLVVAAACGLVPTGRYAAHRALATPACAAAAGLALAWDPAAERLPMVVGIAALAGAVVAALARATAAADVPGLLVWMVAGGSVFVVAGVAAVAGLAPAVVWSVLLVLAMLAARFVPSFTIDVPDNVLLDLDRLAVTAWSARDQRRPRRGRMIVSPRAIRALVERATRLVLAACVAVLAVTWVSAPALLAVSSGVDRIGARVLVGAVGFALLAAARSFRHAAARTLLRVAGLGALATLVVDLLPAAGWAGWAVAIAALVVAGPVVVAAVATGRGWRSVWWAAKADLVEGLSGAVAIAATVVATGVFANLWKVAYVGLGR